MRKYTKYSLYGSISAILFAFYPCKNRFYPLLSPLNPRADERQHPSRQRTEESASTSIVSSSPESAEIPLLRHHFHSPNPRHLPPSQLPETSPPTTVNPPSTARFPPLRALGIRPPIIHASVEKRPKIAPNRHKKRASRPQCNIPVQLPFKFERPM